MASQVFATVELLSMILSHLEMREILVAQRVNVLWNDVVCNSKKLQRKKFLLADCPNSQLSTQTNPLYLQRFAQQACLHTLRQLSPDVHFLGIAPFVSKTMKGFASAEASWRKMLLFQPPVKRMIVRVMSEHFTRSKIVCNDRGLMMADLVDFVEGRGEIQCDVGILVSTVVRKVVWVVDPYDA